MSYPWIIRPDLDLANRTKVEVTEDYERSTISSTELWSKEKVSSSTEGALIYNVNPIHFKALEKYDLYPDLQFSTPLISERVRQTLSQILADSEVGFFPSKIIGKSGQVLHVWAMYPLNKAQCVDRENSDIDWYHPEKNPDDVIMRKARKLKLKENCLGHFNIIRLQERKSVILLSEKFKFTIESVNSTGVRFIRDYQFVYP